MPRPKKKYITPVKRKKRKYARKAPADDGYVAIPIRLDQNQKQFIDAVAENAHQPTSVVISVMLSFAMVALMQGGQG